MNRQELLESVVQDQLKTDLPVITEGDTVDVHVRIVEGDKERTQVFQGVVIAMKGRGINESITVRRIVANQGVERVFPLHSPRIAKIEIVRRGDARRAKLYYLRDRVGKARRLRDQRRGLNRLARMEAERKKEREQAEAQAKARAEAAASSEPAEAAAE